jgi:selenide,water dikinase
MAHTPGEKIVRVPRLTSLSHGAGCACKLSPDELGEILRHIPPVADPRVLVDAATRDDAAVFRLSDERAIVATVDFFAPVVDDPYDFGAIAAANAFSDLYAMGATPLLALNIVAWPRAPEVLHLLGDVLRGGNDVARAAGAVVVGGHSIDDPEPKYGMVALGELRPEKVITNAGARTGDSLVLTKAIGTGVLTTALKRDLMTAGEISGATESMKALNATAAHAMLALGSAVHAATDVTGFGLLGHLGNIVRASRCRAVVRASRVPLLPGARAAAERGAIPGGTQRNLRSAEAVADFAPEVSPLDRLLLADAQTSGGLLIAVDSARAEDLVTALVRAGSPVTAAVIGEIVPGRPGTIGVVA